MMIRSQTDPQASVVTHQHKTVRKQFIDVNIPSSVADDEEVFVVRIRHGAEIVLRPRDYQQFIACLRQAASDAGMVA